MKKSMHKMIAAGLCALLAGCGQVDTGEVGIFTRWGEVISNKPEAEGIHFYFPIGTSLITYDCRNQVANVDTEVFTKDLQSARVRLAVTYALERGADSLCRFFPLRNQAICLHLPNDVLRGA